MPATILGWAGRWGSSIWGGTEIEDITSFQRISALQRIHDFCLVLSTSPFQPVSCFSGFCVSAVSFSMVFVVHFSVSTSFLFQRLLRFSGFIKSRFHITTFPFQAVPRFSGSCASAVSLSTSWLSASRFRPIFRFSICGEGRKEIAPRPKLRYVPSCGTWGRGDPASGRAGR